MRILITHNEKDIGVVTNYAGATPSLVGQIITELELIKIELMQLYKELEE